MQAYFGGFVANRMRRWTKCNVCLSTLTKERGDDPRDALINELSKGYLLYPSNELHGLLTGCERAIQRTVGTGQLDAYSFLKVADNILAESVPFVGCTDHQGDLTRKVINYYAVSRARIISRMHNRAFDEDRKASQQHRKQAKL